MRHTDEEWEDIGAADTVILKEGDIVRRYDSEPMSNDLHTVELFRLEHTGKLHGFPVGWKGDLAVNSAFCTGTIQNLSSMPYDTYVKVGERSGQSIRYSDEQDEGPEQDPAADGNPMDVQIDGSHYKDQGIQPVEYIHANELDFFEGNIVKYTTRHRLKGGAKDIRKVIHYAEMILELEYGERYGR